jgi:Lamin Tail Domain/Bacterial Ig-like domain
MKNNLQICRFSILKTFTAKVFLTIALQIIPQQMFAQFFDDFSDEDFSYSPSWSGLASMFTITAQQLKLDAPPANEFAYLTTPSNAINEATWEFYAGMDFNPSATNYARIYLVSDESDLSDALNGYFVLIGNTTDEVSLYRQTGLNYTKIIDGTDRLLDFPTLAARIKVSRDLSGQWELFVDVGLDGTYNTEGTAIDSVHTRSLYFGVFCNYTSTRSDKFYFDDFNVTGMPEADTLAPTLISATLKSSTELSLTFSENIDIETAQITNNYSVDHVIGVPSKASVENNTVILSFDVPFSSDVSYSIIISGIKDLAGNLIGETNRKFFYVTPTPPLVKDIIFTEIFADPSPKIGLPEFEFIELFNRGKHPQQLEGWQIMDASSTLKLPSIALAPGEYLILSSSSREFSDYGVAWGNAGFPSLNNSGDLLVLRDVNNQMVDSLQYTDDWYRDNDRKNGGWSLELIDPENLCSADNNWTTSEDPSGGTPGKKNSVFANKPDLKGPRLISGFPSTPSTVTLTFNETLDAFVPGISSFAVEPNIGIHKVAFTDRSLTKVNLSFVHDLEPGILYSVLVTSVSDCSGNLIDADFNKIAIALPVPAEPQDIVVNEILFNPKPTGVDFLELVNKSQKFINLKNWSIGNMSEDLVSSLEPIIHADFLFKPGAYIVLTEDVDAVKGQYPALPEENVIVVNKLPAFNDDEGSVVILDDRQSVIDHFHYSDDLHSVFINDEEGVSLERIALDRPSNDNQNWKSASSMAGFATPGYANSNAINERSVLNESIIIEPEVFIPIVGNPDFALIRYRFDKGGYVANVKIFDNQGHVIKRLANNEVLGTEGEFRWDGDRDNGNPARTGYYMVWFEVFDNTGEVKATRKPIAIAARF